MATLVLQTAGTVVGSFFGPVGAAIGSAVGGMIGSTIDQSFLAKTKRVEGPRLDNLQVMASSEGTPIPRLYGAMRMGGQIIWATQFEEIATTKKSGQKGAKQVTTTYAYRANFAVGLCEGPISHVRRVWADGKPLDMKSVVMRVHRGDDGQAPDPLIVAKEGQDNAPAYRGLAYVVFEHLPLEAYGNRLPQLTFEVMKPVGGLDEKIRAVTLIPGGGEFVYDDRVITLHPKPGVTQVVNRHMPTDSSDFVASLDELQAVCPNLERVSLVVAWFGDDLRAGQCTLTPRVETAVKATYPVTWRVAGLARSDAILVSKDAEGRPAYGGTPSDESVIRAIDALKARGLKVTLYPFVMMDIPPANGRPDPWSEALDQPAYPWRGRITVDPAPGRPGTADATAAAALQIDAFFGTAAPAQFAASPSGLLYTGAPEWSYRRMVLHYAHLAALAGGVEAFVIGSEMIGLTRARAAPGVYPAVPQLIALAQDAKSVLGAQAKIVYGADWTEYGAHVLDGGQEVRFPLDPLWASSAIDAVAVDWYAPLSDWRDGADHLDAQTARGIYDLDYLKSNMAGGEGFDWYYAGEADRLAQIRSPITDGAYGKPFVFRQKDLLGWWSSAHVERAGGVELAGPTPWLAQSKPIWILETGCPAIDKGSNRPSCFPDPKSSESAKPPFSNGASDDLIQARAIEAQIAHWAPGSSANPLSPVYGGPMVDPDRFYLWAWDARPFPAFPNAADVWSDSANWTVGHWLNGRLGAPSLDHLVASVIADHGVQGVDTSGLDGHVPGLVIDRPMAARDALAPLAQVFSFGMIDRAGVMTFRHAGGGAIADVEASSLADDGKQPLVARMRAQETELPRAVTIAFADPDADYKSAVETSRRLETHSRAEVRLDAALVLTRGEAARRADIVLQDSWIARETASFALPPSRIALEPGDLVRLNTDGRPRLHLVTRTADAGKRMLEARRVEPLVFERPGGARAASGFVSSDPDALPHAKLIDLPLLKGASPIFQWLAATAKPWPGPLNVWRSTDGTSFSLVGLIEAPATMATLLEPLELGPVNRWDRAGSLLVEVAGSGDFVSRGEAEVLDGANAVAVRRPDAGWEVLQFTTATPVSEGVLRLSGLLRGQLGTDATNVAIAPGADVVLIDEALRPCVVSAEDVARPLIWRVGKASLDVGDDAVVELQQAAGTTVLRPYSPAHVRAIRRPEGTYFSWIRRTRVDGDSWEGEVPLGEESEAYQIDLLDGGVVKRTLSQAVPPLFYRANEELADFGSLQASFVLNLYQLSASIGRGSPKKVIVHV